MMKIKWSSKMKNRSRTPQLFVKLARGEWRRFDGLAIPGLVAVLAAQHTKRGKWSGTEFVLAIKSAIVVQVLQPFEGFGSTWGDHTRAITVLAGQYDKKLAARELLPRCVSAEMRHSELYDYECAIERANENERVLEALT